ncbi:MAG: hypothetical protein VKO44_08275 [Cyanobacteriota bacterium]|nr:hypothetical protein [Cyanobacteriota bacterium]
MALPTPAANRRWSHLLALALAVPLAGWLPPAKAATVFSFISSPYSSIGASESVSVGPDNGFEITPWNYDNKTLYFNISDFRSNPDYWLARWWSLRFTGPVDVELAPGVYADAARFADEGSSGGLDFSGNGRGVNSLTGSFTIWEFSHADDGTLLSFAADFLQYDNGHPDAWNKGAIRYNSDVAIDLTPEPYTPLPAPPSLDDPLAVIDPPVVEEPPVSLEPPVEEPPPIAIELPPAEDPAPSEPPVPSDDDGSFVWWPIYSGGSFSSSGSSGSVEPIVVTEFTTMAAPGPLPMAGAFAGWRCARRLRRRCRAASSGASPNPRA